MTDKLDPAANTAPAPEPGEIILVNGVICEFGFWFDDDLFVAHKLGLARDGYFRNVVIGHRHEIAELTELLKALI